MGGKHLKRVRAEKSKVHLKRKLLPKGQNVTNTTFTVKKIFAVEQLKKVEDSEPVSSWKVPLKDLLIRLSHYNFTARLNSLSGIKELLLKHPEILKGPHLKSITERLLELITDVEHRIRVTAINLLSSIFDSIPPASIIPFHDILTVHLGCAMTHRTDSIQYDSLKFINVLIKYSPGAVKCNFKSITENFIRILKKYLQECHSDVFLTKGSQQGLEKARTDVLSRFYQFLAVGYLNTAEKEFFKPKCYNVKIPMKHDVSLRGTSSQYKQIPDLLLLSKISESREGKMIENDLSEFQSLCLLVLPLVFNTWTEYSPNQAASECVLSEGIGELLSVLLKILLLLYEKAVALRDAQLEYWFVSNYSQTFKNIFSTNFPYLSISTKRAEVNQGSNFSEWSYNGFVLQNLIICFLSYSFKVVNGSSQMDKKMKNYLKSALLMKNQTEIETLLKAVGVVLNSSRHTKPETFLSNVVTAHNTTNNPKLRQGLSKALMQIVLDENNAVYLKNDSIMQWMKSLPICLCQSEIFVQEIEDLLKLINKPIGSEILKEVECKGEEIIKNIPNIRIKGTSQLEGQRLIVNILYRCSSEVLEELVEKKNLIDSSYPPELRNYFLDIFSQKFKKHFQNCNFS